MRLAEETLLSLRARKMKNKISIKMMTVRIKKKAKKITAASMNREEKGKDK